MAIHKLQIDDFVTVDYKLIAIHSSLEDYRLAYFINRDLNLRFEKSPTDVEYRSKAGESCFSRYIFENISDDTLWSLVQNKNTVAGQANTASLFGDTGVTASVFLIPEYKKVDYILKIENTPASFPLNEWIESLLAIKHITTAYSIDHNKLKSKNNLIF